MKYLLKADFSMKDLRVVDEELEIPMKLREII